jgi:putative MATE family efflux protein
MVAANTVHVAVALLLVFGGGQITGVGLTGIALATLLSRGLGVLLMLGLLSRGVAGLTLGWSRPRRAAMKEVWQIGSAVGGEQVALRLGQLVNVRIVAGLSTGALAAYGVVVNTLSLILMLGVGFMTATLALVGQQIGADDRQSVYRTGWLALRLAWAVMGGLAVAFYLWTDVGRLFTVDEQVLALAKSGLLIVLLGVPFEVVNQILTGVLRGAGDTATPMWLTLLGHWVVRLPLILVFVHVAQFGLNAVWAAMVIEMAVRSVFYVQRFRSGFWLREPQSLVSEARQT